MSLMVYSLVVSYTGLLLLSTNLIKKIVFCLLLSEKKYQNILKDVLLTVFNCIERFILLLLS